MIEVVKRKISNRFPWLFTKQVLVAGMTKAGKTTFLKVLELKRDLNPTEIGLDNGEFKKLIKFRADNGITYNIKAMDHPGLIDYLNSEKFKKILKSANYIILTIDVELYLAVVKDKDIDKILQKRGLSASNRIDLNNIMMCYLHILSEEAKTKEKYVIVCSHFDEYLKNSSLKAIVPQIVEDERQNLKTYLVQQPDLLKQYVGSGTNMYVADLTKHSECNYILNELFK